MGPAPLQAAASLPLHPEAVQSPLAAREEEQYHLHPNFSDILVLPSHKLPTSLSSVHLFFLSAVGSVFLHLSIECVSLVLTSEHFRSTFFKNKNTNKKSMRFRLVSAKNGFFRRQWPQDWICVGLALGEVGAECEGVIGWWPWLGMYLWFW